MQNQQGDDQEQRAAAPPAARHEDPRDSSGINIFGFCFHDTTLNEAAETLLSCARNGQRLRGYFVNAHCINVAARNKDYHAILGNSQLLYADGIGMAIAARICGSRLKNNINGTDLFPLLCEAAARMDVPIALIGGAPGIADTCATRMKDRYPGLRVVWTHHGYSSQQDNADIIQAINKSGARLLLAGMGVPLQELWIDKNALGIEAPVVIGVGALFDFYSGSVKRAPLFIRKARMEWLFRLLIEPRRMFTRYIIGNPVFLIRALKWRYLNKPDSGTCS